LIVGLFSFLLSLIEVPLFLCLFVYLEDDPESIRQHEHTDQYDDGDGDFVHILLEIEEAWQHQDYHCDDYFVEDFDAEDVTVGERLLDA